MKSSVIKKTMSALDNTDWVSFREIVGKTLQYRKYLNYRYYEIINIYIYIDYVNNQNIVT